MFNHLSYSWTIDSLRLPITAIMALYCLVSSRYSQSSPSLFSSSILEKFLVSSGHIEPKYLFVRFSVKVIKRILWGFLVTLYILEKWFPFVRERAHS